MTTGSTTSLQPQRRWHTSSYTNDRGECVEVAEGPTTAVRDSKHPHDTTLSFNAREWCVFLDAAKRGSL